MRFHIGNLIEKIRSERGMKQAELAAQAHMRPNTLGDLENQRKNSKVETLEKVATALGFTVGELYCELDQELRARYPKQASQAASDTCLCSDQMHRKLQVMLDDILHGSKFFCHGIVADVVSLWCASQGCLPSESPIGLPTECKHKVRPEKQIGNKIQPKKAPGK
jgi:transcriptional regulator with XRE-family HTH domain